LVEAKGKSFSELPYRFMAIPLRRLVNEILNGYLDLIFRISRQRHS
jgi:hypothetical protein